MENRPATIAVSPSMASPKFSATPWAKYSPSPSHASPSAGILKRKCDTPSSTEVGRIVFFYLFCFVCDGSGIKLSLGLLFCQLDYYNLVRNTIFVL